MLIACACEMFGGMNALQDVQADVRESSKPTPPPSAASNTLSVRNCRVSRERLAPSARRKAISFCRTAARARSRLATFAHAISRTNPTAPSKNEQGRFDVAYQLFVQWRHDATRCACSPPDTAFARRAAIVVISACACCSVTPGFVRAITSR